MLTAGLIGGVSWHSTLEYYRIINAAVARALGGVASARLVLVSLNFEDLRRASQNEASGEHARIYADAGRALQRAGADFIVICSNTGHRRAEDVERATGLPVLHIADVVGSAVQAAGHTRIALLGTAATMESSFIKARLEAQGHLDVVVPDQDVRSELDRLIKGEMSQGVFSDEARAFVLRAIDGLQREQGTQAAVLGCTELPILLDGQRSRCPMFDTLRLHAEATAERMLAGRGQTIAGAQT